MTHNPKGCIAPYFEPTCAGVFDDFLSRYSFSRVREEKVLGVLYRRDDVFLEITYWPEDYPRYFPLVGIGFFEISTEGRVCRRGVSLWSMVPETAPERHEELSKFSNEMELRAILERIRETVVIKYGRPVWEHPARLREFMISKQKKETAMRVEMEIAALRREAKAAFDGGKYKDVIILYSKIPESALSAIDRKRLTVAKRRTR